jgi:hypothetical protein
MSVAVRIILGRRLKSLLHSLWIYTMNRCLQQAVAGLALVLLSSVALAQVLTREAPKDVKPAVIGVSATPPVITVNGQPDRLSPGARIRDLNNMLVLSGSLAGKNLYTVYRRDSAGLVHEVWLLTAEEYQKLGGANAGDPNGFARFVELLNLIFAARVAKAVQ